MAEPIKLNSKYGYVIKHKKENYAQSKVISTFAEALGMIHAIDDYCEDEDVFEYYEIIKVYITPCKKAEQKKVTKHTKAPAEKGTRMYRFF